MCIYVYYTRRKRLMPIWGDGADCGAINKVPPGTLGYAKSCVPTFGGRNQFSWA